MIPGHSLTSKITRDVHSLVSALRQIGSWGRPGPERLRIMTEGEIKMLVNHEVMYPLGNVCYCDTLGVSPYMA